MPVRSLLVGVKPVMPSVLPITLPPPSVFRAPAMSGPLPAAVLPATTESVSDSLPPLPPLLIAPPLPGPPATVLVALLPEKVLPVIVRVPTIKSIAPPLLLAVLPEKVLFVIVTVPALPIAPP